MEILGDDLTIDDRAYLMQLIVTLKIEDALLMLYPAVFPISDLVLEQQYTEVSFIGRFTFPLWMSEILIF